MALAYAANAAPDSGARPVALTPADGRRARGAAPAATTQVARIPPKAGQRYNDPWLRGITLATSVHYDDERDGLRQARRAPGAHDDDQAGVERADDVRRRSL